MRDLAGHDHDRAQQVLRWPIREGLLAYRSHMRHQALAQWQHAVLVWAILAPNQERPSPQPPIPDILKDLPHGDA